MARDRRITGEHLLQADQVLAGRSLSPAAIKEQQFWDSWNVRRVKSGLVRERRSLCEATVAEVAGLGLEPGATLLEVGCGAGWIAERLHWRFDYLGLDLAPAAIAAARARVPAARFEVGDFHDWRAPAGRYDVVVCMDAIAYFRDQDLALAKMVRSLKPRGWLVVTTLNPFVYSRMSRIGPPGDGQFRKWLTKHAFHDLLSRHGFHVLRSRTIHPDGDQGILRWTNAPMPNRPFNALLGEQRVTQLKELAGLGQFRVAVARRVGWRFPT